MPTAPPVFNPRPQTKPDARVSRLHDRKRGSAASRGYDAAWRRLRLVILDRDPACAHCGMALSEHVDHIVSIREAPERRLDPTNLRGLCPTCHNSTTARHDGGYGNARKPKP